MSNLTLRQWKTVDVLKDNDDYIIVETDKNLGGATLNRLVYTISDVSEHLDNTIVYKQPQKKEAANQNNILR